MLPDTSGRSFDSAPKLLICTLLLALLVAGCDGGSSSQSTTAEGSHLAFVADGYGLFLKQHRRVPKDESEFREFIAKVATDDPRAAGHSIDQLLTSERDNKPYGIFTSQNASPANSIYAAYEQMGVGGMRFVADTAGNIKEVDETTFRELVPSSP